MEKSDLVNIFSVIKKGLYEYDIGYFDENSLNVIDKNKDEVMALEKIKNIMGGGYLDTLNEYCDMYVEMKGGGVLEKWKLKMKTMKSKGKLPASFEVVRKRINKAAEKFSADVKNVENKRAVKNIDNKLIYEIDYEILQLMKKMETIKLKMKKYSDICLGDKTCHDKNMSDIDNIRNAINGSIDSLEKANDSLQKLGKKLNKTASPLHK